MVQQSVFHPPSTRDFYIKLIRYVDSTPSSAKTDCLVWNHSVIYLHNRQDVDKSCYTKAYKTLLFTNLCRIFVMIRSKRRY